MRDENLIKNLEKLSKCKALPASDLEGKYKKAYMSLKADLKNCATEYLKQVALEGIRWHDMSTDYLLETVEEINSFVESQAGKAILHECSQAVYKKCSFEDLQTAALKMREQIKHIVWKHVPADWTTIEIVKGDKT